MLLRKQLIAPIRASINAARPAPARMLATQPPSRGSSLKVYGHYVSQPARSVLWLLKMKNEPFEFVKVEPLKGDARTPEFKSKFPLSLVPAIEDFSSSPTNPFRLAEGSAILTYLCEKNGWSDLWPSLPSERGRLNEYFSHHNSGPRLLSRSVFIHLLRNAFFGDEWSEADRAKGKVVVERQVESFKGAFLCREGGLFVGGRKTPTIADLLAYPEFAQLSQLGFVSYSREEHGDKFMSWLQAMEKLPGHDDVHQTVLKIAKMWNKPLVVSVGAVAVAVGVPPSPPAYVRKSGVSSPSSLSSFLSSSSSRLIVVDVRNPDFGLEPGDAGTSAKDPIAGKGGEGHRPRAVNVPFDRKSKAMDEALIPERWIEKGGGRDSVPIVTHCGGGGRGQKAKEDLESKGFKNVVNGGGPEDEECWKVFGAK